MIKTIIFDYDGVIVDSFPKIYITYKVICSKLNKPFPESIDKFKKLYDKSIIDLRNNLGIKGNEHELAEKIYIQEIKNTKTRIFHEIKEVVEKLSLNHKLIILSSNYEFEIKKTLKENGLLEYFSKIVGKSDVGPIPFNKLEPIKNILKENNLLEKEVVMIGDRDKDYFVAKDAGLKNIIIVEYGWGHTVAIPESKIKVNSPKDIIKLITSFNEE